MLHVLHLLLSRGLDILHLGLLSNGMNLWALPSSNVHVGPWTEGRL